MMRMKHLLKKLHIGGGGGLSDHHGSLDELQSSRNLPPLPPPPLPSSSSSTSGPSTFRGQTRGQGFRSPVSSASTSVSTPSSRGQDAAPGDFSLFEEEYQVQLALAISVSDPDGKEDPEAAQINAAKRMSLGCTPIASMGVGGSENNLMEILSQRYWNCNMINYDEKVMDGFYDVYGIINSSLQGKMPLLVDLQSASSLDSVDYEVVLVNRTIDHPLQQLEKRAISISVQCRATDLDPYASGLIQKIADLVVHSMGGPVSDVDDMLRRWTCKSYELRTTLNTIVLPLGCLEVGLSRHRALLFKVLADRIDLPCKLMKGSYYTGTDEGAVNLIKIDHRSEFIIDLMGAPGALIPAEIPTYHLQNAEFDLVNTGNVPQSVKDLSVALGSNTNWHLDGEGEGYGRSSFDPLTGSSSVDSLSEEHLLVGPSRERDNIKYEERNDTEKFEHDFGKLLPSLTKAHGKKCGVDEPETPTRQMKVSDVSKYVVSAAKNPEFAQKLHAVLLESGASPPPDLFSDINSLDGIGGMQDLGQKFQIKEQSNMGQDKLQFHAKRFLLPILKSDFTICDSENYHQFLPVKDESENSDPKMNVSGNHSAVSFENECSMLPSTGSKEMVDDDTNAVSTSSPDIEVECKGSEGVHTYHNDDCSQLELRNTLSLAIQADAGRNMEDLEIKAVFGDVAECEIPWNDLQIGERIGIGSYGEVYHGDWNGTEVAVKKFLDQDLSGDALEQFRCEVRIMLRLRHPNVVLFMGAVTRPPNLSILTEFLPRGSLYRLLHRSKVQIDEKRRLRMALDVAKGMNYLHTSHPTIVHRDLKSPNLLVDKNWVVKVCDFGLSRLKHHTFLSSKSTAGTPEWMAPEVLRNERSNEKCDVYSFGVILWELATLRIPWSGMNPMQVVGAVGFQNRHLEIPKDVDPLVAKIICDCWHNEPNERPSFAELMAPLKILQHLVVENP